MADQLCHGAHFHFPISYIPRKRTSQHLQAGWLTDRRYCKCLITRHRAQSVSHPALSVSDDLIHNIVVHFPGETPILTDHSMVSYQCRVSESGGGNCRDSTVVYNFPKADWTGLCNHLLKEDFSICHALNDFELIWVTIKNNYHICYGSLYFKG